MLKDGDITKDDYVDMYGRLLRHDKETISAINAAIGNDGRGSTFRAKKVVNQAGIVMNNKQKLKVTSIWFSDNTSVSVMLASCVFGHFDLPVLSSEGAYVSFRHTLRAASVWHLCP
ncbi:hypothetical protein BDQ17DRAFT_1339282 [Cyathus striatus]|nr:hypothetical protein BDQ17DRAFT_1339282 [Cyathus striatus]